MFVEETGVVEGELFAFWNSAQGDYIEAFVFSIGITAMVLRSPVGRIVIPEQKHFFAEGIGVFSKNILFFFIPVLIHMLAGDDALRGFFQFENDFASRNVLTP